MHLASSPRARRAMGEQKLRDDNPGKFPPTLTQYLKAAYRRWSAHEDAEDAAAGKKKWHPICCGEHSFYTFLMIELHNYKEETKTFGAQGNALTRIQAADVRPLRRMALVAIACRRELIAAGKRASDRATHGPAAMMPLALQPLPPPPLVCGRTFAAACSRPCAPLPARSHLGVAHDRRGASSLSLQMSHKRELRELMRATVRTTIAFPKTRSRRKRPDGTSSSSFGSVADEAVSTTNARSSLGPDEISVQVMSKNGKQAKNVP